MSWLGLIAAWIPFVHPLILPAGARLWTFLPLALCVAIVYRATRAKSAAELPKGTAITFVNIVVGMVAIALVAYIVHEVVLRISNG